MPINKGNAEMGSGLEWCSDLAVRSPLKPLSLRKEMKKILFMACPFPLISLLGFQAFNHGFFSMTPSDFMACAWLSVICFFSSLTLTIIGFLLILDTPKKDLEEKRLLYFTTALVAVPGVFSFVPCVIGLAVFIF